MHSRLASDNMEIKLVALAVTAICLYFGSLVTAECDINRYNQERLPCHTLYKKDNCESLRNWYHCLNETFKNCNKVRYEATREYVENSLIEAHQTCGSCTILGQISIVAACLFGIFMWNKHV